MPKAALTRRRDRRPAGFCQEQTPVMIEQFSSMERDASHVSYLSDKIPGFVFHGQTVKTSRSAAWSSNSLRHPQTHAFPARRRNSSRSRSLRRTMTACRRSAVSLSFRRPMISPPCSSHHARLDLLFDLGAHCAFGDVEVITGLKIDPELRRRPKIAPQAQCGVGRDAAASEH